MGSCVDGPHRARIFYDAEVRSVGCRHVSGLSRRRARPLALMRSANRVPINYAGSEARPRYRVSQSSVTTDLHQLRVTLAIGFGSAAVQAAAVIAEAL
jgi:hypothetical protein